MIIALLKAILSQYSVLVNSPQGPQQVPGMPGQPNTRANGGATNGVNGAAGGDSGEPSAEDIDASRTREITAKAVTGILLLLLKWLKISRKFSDDTFTHFDTRQD